MSAVYSLGLMTVTELCTRVKDCQKSLDELAPYNGTAQGATFIGKVRDRRDAALAELKARPKTIMSLAEKEETRRAVAIGEGRCPNQPRYCRCPEHYEAFHDFQLELAHDDPED